MADGKTCDTVTSVIIALETDAGITGGARCVQFPTTYLPMRAVLPPQWKSCGRFMRRGSRRPRGSDGQGQWVVDWA